MTLYWGDLHNHCGISYGFGSLENALNNARVHLDFCAITGHAMWPDMISRNPETAFLVDFHREGFAKLRDNWPQVQKRINEANTSDFVTFQSYEMHSSLYGDRHFLSPDSDFPLIYRDSPDALVHDCGHRSIAVPHHIGYTPGYRGISWDLYNPAVSPIVEVVSKHGAAMREDGPFPYYHDMGPLDAHNTVAEGLKRGFRFSFVGSTDHHAGFPGSWGDGLAAVYANEKSRESIWESLLAGHCYAVNADRIRCSFTLNHSMMGDMLSADNRHVLLHAEGDAPIEFATISRNGQKIAMTFSQPVAAKDRRFLLRIEMGWSSSPDLFHWEGALHLEDGVILRVTPYLRGLNALSPHDSEVNSEENTNRLNNGFHQDRNTAFFWCDTVCNKSTLHPQTCAFVFEIEADPSSQITLDLNGKKQISSLRQLLESGYSAHLKPWASHAFKMHTAYPASACQVHLELDDKRHTPWDYYQAEVTEVNGSRAFISPIFVI